ncbi:hypothetical protein MUN84_19355 [Hymenobacter sp. 5516J-16]|uniref:hypothetical protein n=1 Tax=Hymenobacter sp. 5516J-16 TaxID=2932253 RepID=UPI001FD45467|nr:hypothetical protein [Hymenobacter sp. 5516J-16]UOQ76657.1 hypothetical protein MUN84_19355 [Hymenobacter sp. 5516J-16]
MKLFVGFLFSALVVTSYGQEFSYPVMRTKGQEITDFVPQGWLIHDSAVGDLNKDGLPDAALILQHKTLVTQIHEGSEIKSQPRILAILVKSGATGGFELKEQSNTFIPEDQDLENDDEELNDPFLRIEITRGLLELVFQESYKTSTNYSAGTEYKFRYNGQDFQLIGADFTRIHRMDFEREQYSYNFLMKKRIYSKGKIGGKTTSSPAKSFALPALKTLKTLKAPNEWEIEPDVTL